MSEFKKGDKVVATKDGMGYCGFINAFTYKEGDIGIIIDNQSTVKWDKNEKKEKPSPYKLKKINNFSIGDKVILFGVYKGKVFGVSDKDGKHDESYAVTYEDDYGEIRNAIVNKESLSFTKSKNELEEGDKFIKDGVKYTILDKYKNKEGRVYYFAKSEKDKCMSTFPKLIDGVVV